jgi:Flp pilus assembly protein TadD
MQSGQQDAAYGEMNIARELANKTLAQDKSKLAGLMETSGSADVPAPAAEAGKAASVASAAADSMTLRSVESMRAQIRLPVADSYNNLGAIAATNNDYSDAVTYFKHAAMWNPSLEGLDYNWGRAAFAGSQFADAILPLSRYVKSHPDDIGARSVLAVSQFMAGNYRGCMETLESVIGNVELAPEAEYVYAESMVRTGRIASGAERLQALEKSHPEIPDVHRSLGEAFAQQGEKQRALEELRTAIQLSPSDAGLHYDLGKIELESGDAEEAIRELETATRLSPNSEKFHRQLADAYTAARRPADAQKEMATCNLLRAHASPE